MKNQPMTSGDQSKLLIFSLLMIPSLVFLFGIIPAIFLGFGIYMMKKNQDFTSIDTAVKNFKGYAWLALIGSILGFIFCEIMYFSNDDSSFLEGSIISLIVAGISIVYLIMVQVLFYSPLKRHSEWVEVNGIFSTKPRPDNDSSINSEVDIIKGEKLKHYSVADELTKWAKLKEDGHISEDEYNKARAKLLKR